MEMKKQIQKKGSGNLANNCLIVVSINKALSRIIIHMFCKFMTFAPEIVTLKKSDSPKLPPSLHPV
jgi:hypothetical protein